MSIFHTFYIHWHTEQVSAAHRHINKWNAFLSRSPSLGPLLDKSSLYILEFEDDSFLSGSFVKQPQHLHPFTLNFRCKIPIIPLPDVFTYYTPAACWGCLLHSNKVVLMLMFKLYSFFWCVQSLVMVSYTVRALRLCESVFVLCEYQSRRWDEYISTH